MKNAFRVMLSTLASLMLVAALWATPPATSDQSTPAAQAPAAQSVSGKITAVAKDSFTLAVGGSASPGQQFVQTPAAKSMTFQIDKNTTIEGKLKVDASADVTYREEGGRNIAISVHVAS
jgi:hypothetical protein